MSLVFCIGIEPAMNWVLEHMGDPGIEIGIFNNYKHDINHTEHAKFGIAYLIF